MRAKVSPLHADLDTPAWVLGDDDVIVAPKRGSGPPSFAYNSFRVAQRRALLIHQLGGVCALCGEDGENDTLEFDHIHGRDYKPSRLSQWGRLARYEREATLGLLRVLCRGCNGGHNPYKRA